MRAPISPVMVTARLNETRPMGRNRFLPISTQELIEEGLAAAEAGAAILHWHARDPSGDGLAADPGLYWTVTEAIRSHSDVLVQPGILHYRVAPAERVRHVTQAADHPSWRPDIVPVEMGPFAIDRWDAAARRFESLGGIYELGNDRIHGVLEALAGCGQFVAAACWGPAQLRTARCFQEVGVLHRHPLWELVFTGDSFPGGPAPSALLLDAMVAEVPAGDPWLTYTWDGDGLPMAAWTIARGGHVGIGLGDHEYDGAVELSNADLVRRVAGLAEDAGRALATPDQARRLLGLRERLLDTVRES